jgi:ubiquinone biosynthesis protein COQ9
MTTTTRRKTGAKKARDDDALKRAILEAALPHVAEDGFGERTLARAAAMSDVDAGTLARLFPGQGLSLVELFSEWADERMDTILHATPLDTMKIRERIKAAVNARIVVLRPHKEAARRAAAFLTLPQNASTAVTLLYRTVDRMWRAAGDTSTDFNFYTKRAILAGVYSSTLLRWFGDDSEEDRTTFEFLDRRIDGVMRFEAFKAQTGEAFSRLPSLSDVIGRFSDRRSSR